MTSPRPALGTPLREQLWSPVQNTALWLGWWLHGLLSTDEVIDAFTQTQGPAHTLLVDRSSGDPFDGIFDGRPTSLVDVLRAVRLVTTDAPSSMSDRPLVGLVLAGPGDVPPLPAGSIAAAALAPGGAGLAIADADPDVQHVLIPQLVDGSLVQWGWYQVEGRTPAPPVHSPGDADRLLREATEQAAYRIESDGQLPTPHRAPRLAVGALSDYFGLPGLPDGVSPRAVQLMARADVVASIIDVARASAAGSSLDPSLLPLLRTVRIARTTAVDYAMRELLR